MLLVLFVGLAFQLVGALSLLGSGTQRHDCTTYAKKLAFWQFHTEFSPCAGVNEEPVRVGNFMAINDCVLPEFADLTQMCCLTSMRYSKKCTHSVSEESVRFEYVFGQC